jgi:hypothetical protein
MPPPLEYWWFSFHYGPSQRSRLEGVQLVGCESETCAKPTLLQQAGTCTGLGCTASPPTLERDYGLNSFKYAGSQCRFNNNHYVGSHFRLVAELDGQVRTSDVVLLPDAEGWGDSFEWRVSVGDQDLAITKDPGFRGYGHGEERFLQWLTDSGAGLLLTQLVELPVAGLCLGLWLKRHTERLS